MPFFLCSLLLMFVGRKVGWAFSKPLYRSPLVSVVVAGVVWGIVVASSIHGLVVWQQPGALLRWVMGYALGAYIAIPNFGLLEEQSIPDGAIRQHVLLKAVPFFVFVLCSIMLGWLG